MKQPFVTLLFVLGLVPIVPGRGDAEIRTMSWGAVTAYSDGTPIEPSKTVTYDMFWTTDAGLNPASLQTVVSSITQTSATFDPDILGMPRGQTVYFTGQVVLNTGEKSSLAPPYSWAVPPISPPPGPPTLSGLSISGPSSVNEGGGGTYTATAAWSDGSTTAVSPAWSENSAFASINASGVLTALAVTANQPVTVSASYSSGTVTRTATRSVTIVDIPAGALAPVQNVAVTGPVATSPARIFRLSWDPAVTYADGTPIPSGSARYTAYWTTDPSLSSGTLKVLASSITGITVDFDPAAAGMAIDQRVYFTAIVTTASGGQSPPAEGVPWVALNPGPAAPTGGTIIRR